MKRLVDRLDAVLSVLAYCRGATCRNPWKALHPEGGVSSFWQAMLRQYDAVYAGYTKFGFTRWGSSACGCLMHVVE